MTKGRYVTLQGLVLGGPADGLSYSAEVGKVHKLTSAYDISKFYVDYKDYKYRFVSGRDNFNFWIPVDTKDTWAFVLGQLSKGYVNPDRVV